MELSIQGILIQTAQDMETLADNMPKDGRPMNPHEKSLCRIAVMPLVEEHIEMFKVNLMSNHDAGFDLNKLQEVVTLVENL